MDLESVLGAPPPPGIERHLSEEELDELAAALRATCEAQRAALAAATTRALDQIPRVFRGPVRKVLGLR